MCINHDGYGYIIIPKKNIIDVMRYRNSFRKDDGFEYSIPIEKGADVVPDFIYKQLLEYAKEQASARSQ